MSWLLHLFTYILTFFLVMVVMSTGAYFLGDEGTTGRLVAGYWAGLILVAGIVYLVISKRKRGDAPAGNKSTGEKR